MIRNENIREVVGITPIVEKRQWKIGLSGLGV